MSFDVGALSEAVFSLDRSTAELVTRVAEFHESGAWEIDGSTSTEAWLRGQGMTRQDAARVVSLAKKLRRLPVLSSAWLAGRVSGGQVQAVCAQVIDRHVDLFATHEAALVSSFESLTVEETARAMSLWRARADALDDGREPRAEPCEARLSTTLDDRGLLTASLDAEGTALATAALALADSNDLDVPAAQRKGQALKDLFRFVLDHQQAKPGARKRPHLNLVINNDTVHTDHIEGFDAESGVRIDSLTLSRLMCDCEFHRMILSVEGAVLDYGRAAKAPPIDLYNAVVIRDQGCRWKSCDRPAAWCHAHHVKWWERDQGPTSINNLVLLCARHHGMVHRKGWQADLYLNGEFEVISPWGHVRRSKPPGARDDPELDWLDDVNDPVRAPDYAEQQRQHVLARLHTLVNA